MLTFRMKLLRCKEDNRAPLGLGRRTDTTKDFGFFLMSTELFERTQNIILDLTLGEFQNVFLKRNVYENQH